MEDRFYILTESDDQFGGLNADSLSSENRESLYRNRESLYRNRE